jgi:hypothetical protein
MIHFQHSEPGACLRATEVKPKLDRFLVDWLSAKGIAIPKEWRLDPKKSALNYKMRIVPPKDGKPTAKPHELYFGNMGKDSPDELKTVFYKDKIVLRIACFCKGTADLSRVPLKNNGKANASAVTLLELLDIALPHFFVVEAFGSRSGKGFGCFTLAQRHGALSADFELFCPDYYFIKYEEKERVISVLDDIWVISGMMKSGFNLTYKHSDDYYKGRIFRFFSNKKIGSDKAFMKNKVLCGTDVSPENEKRTSYQTYRFSRAMLGLTDHIEFRASQNKTTRRGDVTIEHAEKNPDKAIKRFASPVLYRLQNNTLYIIPQKIPDRMFGATFILNDREKIATPTKAEFNLLDFLDFFMGEFNSLVEIKDFKSYKISKVVSQNLLIEKKAGEIHA